MSEDYHTSVRAQPRTPGMDAKGTTGRWPTYSVGFGLAISLTVASFVMAAYHVMTPASVIAGLVVLAVAQMIVHLIFFLHITTAPAHKTNVLAMLLTLLIIALVVIGSIWIMSALNHNMVPMSTLMQMQR